MREFLVAAGFLSDVSALSTTGKSLNDRYANIDSGEVTTLLTCMAYIEQQNAIKTLIDSYISLIDKDVKELIEMQEEAAHMDDALASKLGR